MDQRARGDSPVRTGLDRESEAGCRYSFWSAILWTVSNAAVLALLAVAQAIAQDPSASPTPAAQPLPTPRPWEVSLTVDGYIQTNEGSYVNPTGVADRRWLHLEARYNYEDLQTGSLWIGYNFSAGKKLVFKITPMVGGVFGRTTGIAPGCEASLAYKRVTLSISTEYVFDTADTSKSFYYSWPEVTYSPIDWFRVGLAAQHTKAFETNVNIQSGFLIGFSHKHAEFTTYVFNLGRTDPTVVLEFGWSF